MKHKNSTVKWTAALLGILFLLALSVSPGAVLPAAAQGGIAASTVGISKVLPHEFNGDVRNLPQVPSRPTVEVDLKEPVSFKTTLSAQAGSDANFVLQPVPAASHSFRGMSYTDICSGGTCGAGIPPDTNGDVGPTGFIQAVNSAFAVYSKANGALLTSFSENALWAGTGAGPCDGNSEGDPVVLYDPIADRWILTNFAFAIDFFGNPVAPFYECIAVSKSGDPVSGGWWLYALQTDTSLAGQPPAGTMNDYPKFGIWSDCLYYSANGFNSFDPNFAFSGGEFGSFSRQDMYSGTGLTGALGFAPSSNDYFTMIPANLSAPTSSGLPPSGTPEYYVQDSTTAFAFEVRTLTAGGNCGPGTLSAATTVSQASYAYPGNATTNNIVPQPNTKNKLDSLGDRLMQKVQYRRVGSTESLWVTHTIRSSATGPTGVQWAQLNVTGGVIALAPVQQQRYNPADGQYRWMPSIAADRDGNVAMVYSLSGAASPNFPSIAYAGRLVSDPRNTLPRSERKLVAGAGSQNLNCGGAPCGRWGDYASISVDPVDGCTFWFTSEYYASQTSGSHGTWNTRFGSFRFPTCGSRTFFSTAAQDGWVLESKSHSGLGGSLNATATMFKLGDDAFNRQYRSVVSFNTAGLPDNAQILSVVLSIKQAGLTGGNPFSTLGNILVDINVAPFNSNPALETADFQAAANQSAAMAIGNNPSNGWYSRPLNSLYFPLINLTGITQFRLRFAKATNGNHIADTLSFYSGNFMTIPAYRPMLVIRYNAP